MQLFLPSLIAFIITIAIVFVVLPRLAAPVLVGLSLLILGFALYQHITLFRTEYALSTWQEQLKFYAPFVMIGGLLLAVLTYFITLFSSGTALPMPSLPIISPLPSSESATNSLTSALNTGIRSVSNVGTTAMNFGGNAMNRVANTFSPVANNNRAFTPWNKKPNNAFFSPAP